MAEPESGALIDAITSEQPELGACLLGETGIRRAVMRYRELTQTDAVSLIDMICWHEMPLSLFRDAGLLPGRHLRSLDVLHLATALRIGVEDIVSYDARMTAAATDVGAPVIAPVAGSRSDEPRLFSRSWSYNS